MTQHEQMRRSLWIGMATGVAAAVTITDKKAPASWADHALADFDARFPAPVPAPAAVPGITRTFEMRPDEIAHFTAPMPSGFGHAAAEAQQRKVLTMFEVRGVMDARMPFRVLADPPGRYSVSEAAPEA
ncbi:hypothetical protein [Pseudomonas sp.]|jgi:hypothetical protein|uniref:hypothetical protein n=1 Tax=Pseudomonas sp. TaxID=306 RepID=UPI002ED8DF3D